MSETETGTADFHPPARITRVATRGTLAPAVQSRGVLMQVQILFEDLAPCDDHGNLVDERAGDHMDHTDDLCFYDLDFSPTCVRGPHYSRGEL